VSVVKRKSASRIVAVTFAAALLVPAVSFAQTTQPLTRDQVRAELRRLEQAGYEPAASHDAHYPADLEAAEAELCAAGVSYGSPTSGSSDAGDGNKQSAVSK
jgi:hypothetical protein